MIKKYGKAALVAAIAGSCGYVSAGTVTVTTPVPVAGVSLEGASAGRVPLTTVAVTLGETHIVNDKVELVLTGARFATFAAGAISVACTSGDFLLESQLSSASSTASFTIFSKSAGVTSIGKTCTFSNLEVLGSSISSAGTVTLKSQKNSGGTISDVSASATAFTVASQFGTAVVLSALNGVIDYQNHLGLGFAADDGKTSFANHSGKMDSLVLRIPSTADMYLSNASTMSVVFALSAASGKTFSFLDDGGSCGTSASLNRATSNGRAAVQVGSGASSILQLTINATCTTVTYTGTAIGPFTGTDRDIALEFGHKSATPSTGVVIEPMVFPEATVTISQGATQRKQTTGLLPGSWTSNGSTVQIPYMPVNATAGAGKIDPVIIISNRSTATGAISATVRNEAGATCALTDATLGTIAGNRTKSVGGLIRDAVAGSTCPTIDASSTQRLSITLNVTLPSGSTEVYSGYTVGGADRVTVVNSSNGVPNP